MNYTSLHISSFDQLEGHSIENLVHSSEYKNFFNFIKLNIFLYEDKSIDFFIAYRGSLGDGFPINNIHLSYEFINKSIFESVYFFSKIDLYVLNNEVCLNPEDTLRFNVNSKYYDIFPEEYKNFCKSITSEDMGTYQQNWCPFSITNNCSDLLFFEHKKSSIFIDEFGVSKSFCVHHYIPKTLSWISLLFAMPYAYNT